MRNPIEVQVEEEPDWEALERAFPIDEEEFQRQLAIATERGRIADETEPRAVSARYNPETERIEIELRDGCAFAFPVDIVQGLRGAPAELLAKVNVMGGGSVLTWNELDACYLVPGLLQRRFGNERWMRRLAEEKWHLRAASDPSAAT